MAALVAASASVLFAQTSAYATREQVSAGKPQMPDPPEPGSTYRPRPPSPIPTSAAPPPSAAKSSTSKPKKPGSTKSKRAPKAPSKAPTSSAAPAKETCSVDDPTTRGKGPRKLGARTVDCVTPRALKLLNEVKAAGYTQPAKCFKLGKGWGDHVSGRSCDLTVSEKGFAAPQSRSGKATGDKIAEYLVRRAKELGIEHIVWGNRIWRADTGWKGRDTQRVNNVKSGDDTGYRFLHVVVH